MSLPLSRIAAETALALTVHYLDGPHRVGDALLFTTGRLHLWDRWIGLPLKDRERIAVLLRHSPENLADDKEFAAWAAGALEEGSRFRYTDDPTRPSSLERTFECAAGRSIEAVVDELLDLLRKTHRPPKCSFVRKEGQIKLKGGRLHYSIPASDIPAGIEEVLDIRTFDGGSDLTLDTTRLLALAERYDTACGHRFSTKSVLADLFAAIEVPGQRRPLDVRATLPVGPSTLFVAPTGRGKTVFARMAAIDFAASGVPVALVVPDLKASLEEAHMLEDYAKAVGLTVRATPLNGLTGLFSSQTDALEHAPAHDPNGEWILTNLGYSCRLAGYADSERPAAGDEPCTQLQQISGHKKLSVYCPFSSSCPKLDLYRRALTSDILVVNHHALLAGRMPIPFRDAGQTVPKASLLEVVLRRCGLVLVDEIDRLQSLEIKRPSLGTALSRADHGLSPIQMLFEAVERRRRLTNERADAGAGIAIARRALIHLRWLGEELADALNRGTLTWERGESLRTSRSKDDWIVKTLFGDAEDGEERLSRLYSDDKIPTRSEGELRDLILLWRDAGLEHSDSWDRRRAPLLAALEKWVSPLKGRKRFLARTQSRLADALILRAVLSRLELALQQLRYKLPLLVEEDVPHASGVRESLCGRHSWRSSPLGALGRSPVGFSYRRDLGSLGVLRVETLSGDPHGFVAGLGDEVSLALAGRPRAVLGLSATARFLDATVSDVRAPVSLQVRDRGSQIRIEAVTVGEAHDGGKPLRISGVPAMRDRLSRVSRLTQLLWSDVLADHLAATARDPSRRDRARVLLVTASYDEAKAAAEGLSAAMGSQAEAARRIRCAARKRLGHEIPPVLTFREFDRFVESGADVLVAPLSLVERGHNIVQLNGGKSAISSIFILVRPVLPNDVARALAHVSYGARRFPPSWQGAYESIVQERRSAEKRLRQFQQSSGPFSELPPAIRHELLSDIFVSVAQLAGRARRGGTDVRIYLVDGAFHDAKVGWAPLTARSIESWRERGSLSEMASLHESFFTALADFAGVALD